MHYYLVSFDASLNVRPHCAHFTVLSIVVIGGACGLLVTLVSYLLFFDGLDFH